VHPSFTLVQLTDTHLRPGTELLFGRIDTWRLTLAALREAERHRPDAVVVTGDVADCCSEIYGDAARLFEDAAARLGCPFIVLPGNHDNPGQSEALFNRARAAAGPGRGDTVHFIGGLRVVTLESDDPGQPSGELLPGQLDWLRGQLATPAPDGTIIALHHPPLESPLPVLAGRGLAAPERLRAVVAGTDVRGIICGHYHHAQAGRLGSVPVWVGPAVAFNQDTPGSGGFRTGDAATWISVIRLDAEGFSAEAVPVRRGEGAEPRLDPPALASYRGSDG
jgi:3',5'-cyclic-AMP phosphodiesterase